MEAVLAYAVLLVVLHRKGIEVVGGGYGLVERGVEYGHLRHSRQNLLDREHALQIGGVVQRRDVEERAYVLLGLLVDDAAALEVLASVRHAVAYGADLRQVVDYAVLRVRQGLQHEAYARGVVGDGHVQLILILARGLVCKVAFGQTYALDQTFGHQLAAVAVDVDQLILDRRASAIEYKYNHLYFRFFWLFPFFFVSASFFWFLQPLQYGLRHRRCSVCRIFIGRGWWPSLLPRVCPVRILPP